jgi:hypothetical protein
VLGKDLPQVPSPTRIRRTDGNALFYAAAVNGIFGDPESAKTWLMNVGAVEVLADGGKVAIIDVDHNGATETVQHLLALGAEPKVLADPDRFRYIEPEDGNVLQLAVGLLVAWRPDYVTVDSLGELLPMLGCKSNDNDDVTKALRIVVTPLAMAGACVVTGDHLPKSAEARTNGYAIGGTAKKRAMTGAYLEVTRITPFAPGRVGKAALTISKDRKGGLRATSLNGHAGMFVLDSSGPTTTWRIEPDASTTPAGEFRPTTLMRKVSDYLMTLEQPASLTKIKSAVPGDNVTKVKAVDLLVQEGYAACIETQHGTRTDRAYSFLKAFDETRPSDPLDTLWTPSDSGSVRRPSDPLDPPQYTEGPGSRSDSDPQEPDPLTCPTCGWDLHSEGHATTCSATP